MSQQQSLFFPPEQLAGAIFDPHRIYRYRLWRRWEPGHTVAWIMLNPSTADEAELDPTLRRCQNYSIAWGYGAMEILNVYALRSTDPDELWKVDDPVGPQNLQAIDDVVSGEVQLVVLGWGAEAKEADVVRVLEVLKRHDVVPHCLTVNEDGSPGHPLYLRKTLVPKPWRRPTDEASVAINLAPR